MQHEDGRSPHDDAAATDAEPMVVRAARKAARQLVGDTHPKRAAASGDGWGLGAPPLAVAGLLVGLVLGGLTTLLVGGAIGRGESPDATAAGLAAFEDRVAAVDARLVDALERSETLLERLEAIEAGAAGDAAETGALAAIEAQAEAVEDRVLAMLARSDLAMRQLAELDTLRASEIARLESLRMPAWRGGAGDDEVDARILEMMAGGGALEATLDVLKDAPGTVTTAALSTGGPPAAEAPGAADDAILRMVGGEAGLLGALDTLDRLRERMADALSSRDPAAGELRALGGMERTLRELLLYVEQVDAELAAGDGAAAAVPLPSVPELAELEGDDGLLEEVRRLVARTSALHAALNAAEG
jgi:hypothetical protein